MSAIWSVNLGLEVPWAWATILGSKGPKWEGTYEIVMKFWHLGYEFKSTYEKKRKTEKVWGNNVIWAWTLLLDGPINIFVMGHVQDIKACVTSGPYWAYHAFNS